jgi:hypothetical protein
VRHHGIIFNDPFSRVSGNFSASLQLIDFTQDRAQKPNQRCRWLRTTQRGPVGHAELVQVFGLRSTS